MAKQSEHEFAPNEIASADFPTAFRGFDQDAVRHYLQRLASALDEQGDNALAALTRTTTLDRIEELEEENDVLRADVRDLELELVQRSVEGDDLSSGSPSSLFDSDSSDSVSAPQEFDEHRAIELLGKETARVLESARSAAADIVKRAEKDAKDVERESRKELNEAKREARSLVSAKQVEAEALVAKVATEAEETAGRVRADADQHRDIVLAESKRIMTEAEAVAEVEETRARERAEQIVADAEALRQQILSDLVVERTKTRTDLEEMTSTRDRLVMALAVARSEVESMSGRLDEISVKSAREALDAPPVVAKALPPEEEVANLVTVLDERLDKPDGDGVDTATNGDAGKVVDDDATKSTDTDDTVIDLVELEAESDDTVAPSPNGNGSSSGNGDNANGTSNGSAPVDPKVNDSDSSGGKGGRSSKSSRKRRTGSKRGRSKTNRDAKAELAGSASSTALAELDESLETGDVPRVEGEVELEGEDSIESDLVFDENFEAFEQLQSVPELEIEPESLEVAPSEDSLFGVSPFADAFEEAPSGDGIEIVDSDLDPAGAISFDEAPLESAVEPNPVAKGLIEGFNTIELTEADFQLSDVDADSQSEIEDTRAVDRTTTRNKSKNRSRRGRKRDGNGDRESKAAELDGSTTGDIVDRDSETTYSVAGDPPADEIITTVSARMLTPIPDPNRGDLLIEGDYRGRLHWLFEARDDALARSGGFQRSLRRALNDDQSDVLDRIRAGRGTIERSDLPQFGDQIDRYLLPLREGLAAVAQDGVEAADGHVLSETAIDGLVRQLAKYIVDSVRQPALRVVDADTKNDREAILEPIRDAYREFRNASLFDLAEDALHEAYAIGVYDAIPVDAEISWLVDPRYDPDPVCEINAARHGLLRGDVFPSGHARPLALPNCRCLVVPND